MSRFPEMSRRRETVNMLFHLSLGTQLCPYCLRLVLSSQVRILKLVRVKKNREERERGMEMVAGTINLN